MKMSRYRRPSIFLALMALLWPTFAVASTAGWSGPAPEDLPQVTARWQSAQRKVYIVQGVHYQVKIRLAPVAIVAVDIDGKNLLSSPIVPGFVDSHGVRYWPQQSGVPHWKT